MKFGCLLLALFQICKTQTQTVSKIDEEKYSIAKHRKYFLYDVNHGEGFNLRRDVHMRMANTVRLLRESGHNYVLVLPPWGGLFHWGRQETKVPWRTFFDMESLNSFVPTIEFEDYLEATTDKRIDSVVYLQHFKEGWGSEYKLKYEHRECMDGQKFYRKDGDAWEGWFFSYEQVRSRNFSCVSIQGDSETLKNMILADFVTVDSILIDRGETILHHDYGGKHYWEARRSMRYARNLRDVGDKFRKENFDSDDKSDNIIFRPSWKDEQLRRDAHGGNYVCVHWRRRDFVRAHGQELPSIKGTIKQLNAITEREKVDHIFIATDAPEDEVDQLKEWTQAKIHRFNDENYSDGEIAIIDQWICAHAKYFTGSYSSTFSFRIQEDREILGFKPETTFNRLCPDKVNDCEQPAKWKIEF